MGGNGSFSRKELNYGTRDKWEWKQAGSLTKNIKILEYRKGNQERMPRVSHTANRVYVSIKRDGSDIKEIAKYGKDHRKVWAIHTNEHKGIKPHFHYWKDGRPEKDAHALTPKMKKLLEKVRKMKR
ncbi:MAG: hypothetical protein IJV06_09965 [Bacteroidaceae bacterium]|nr:hypothetical protein [Bacteroidaceae bacterium]